MTTARPTDVPSMKNPVGSNPKQPALLMGERDWLEWLKKADERTITSRQAAEKMGVTEPWVQRLLRERM